MNLKFFWNYYNLQKMLHVQRHEELSFLNHLKDADMIAYHPWDTLVCISYK